VVEITRETTVLRGKNKGKTSIERIIYIFAASSRMRHAATNSWSASAAIGTLRAASTSGST
jgi:hypothetical protein